MFSTINSGMHANRRGEHHSDYETPVVIPARDDAIISVALLLVSHSCVPLVVNRGEVLIDYASVRLYSERVTTSRLVMVELAYTKRHS